MTALAAHVASGTVVFAAGLLAMVTEKGSPRHRASGVAYLAAMAVNVTTAIVLAIAVHSVFLAANAAFIAYLTVSGVLALPRWLHALAFRRTLAVVALVVAAILFAATRGTVPPFSLIGEAFAALLAVLAVDGLRRPRGGATDRLMRHAGAMLGSYVAAVTAVTVVQVHALPLVVAYLGPSTVGIPAILLYVRRIDRGYRS